MLGQERGQRRARRGRNPTGHPNRAVRAVPTEILSIRAQSKQKPPLALALGHLFQLPRACLLVGSLLVPWPHRRQENCGAVEGRGTVAGSQKI